MYNWCPSPPPSPSKSIVLSIKKIESAASLCDQDPMTEGDKLIILEVLRCKIMEVLAGSGRVGNNGTRDGLLCAASRKESGLLQTPSTEHTVALIGKHETHSTAVTSATALAEV